MMKACPYTLIRADWVSRLKTLVCQLATARIDEGSLHDRDCWPQHMQRKLCKMTMTFWRVLRMRLQWMQAIYVQMFEYIFTPAEKKTRLMLQGRWEKGKEPGIKPRAPGWSVAVGSPGCLSHYQLCTFLSEHQTVHRSAVQKDVVW